MQVMSKPLMLVLLGPKWNGIAPIISWLCFASFASPLYSSANWLFVSQGRAGRQLSYAMMTSIISVVGFVAGLPWGPTGVAAGAGLSFFFLATPLTCWGATRVGPARSREVLIAVLPFLAASSGTAVALVILSKFVPAEGSILLLFAFAVAYGTFFVVLLGLPSGRHVLQRAWQLRAMLKRERRSPERNVEVSTLG